MRDPGDEPILNGPFTISGHLIGPWRVVDADGNCYDVGTRTQMIATARDLNAAWHVQRDC